jgi:hypothetical protein
MRTRRRPWRSELQEGSLAAPAVVEPLVDMGDHLWRQALCIDCVKELSAADLSGPLAALQLRFGWLP